MGCGVALCLFAGFGGSGERVGVYEGVSAAGQCLEWGFGGGMGAVASMNGAWRCGPIVLDDETLF